MDKSTVHPNLKILGTIEGDVYFNVDVDNQKIKAFVRETKPYAELSSQATRFDAIPDALAGAFKPGNLYLDEFSSYGKSNTSMAILRDIVSNYYYTSKVSTYDENYYQLPTYTENWKLKKWLMTQSK